ncbi:hypothetical protein AC625_12985 [Peribacillus loiseleuriae]|uniref:Group II intron maturase-specific domain-containing protein n=1 Tax=Peribacillus loiseleuriae TaxID=1679170 RepID=A0A0K9GUD6_9BACI|nr:hypothetical protein AC625_12985 [Peribacillus loiseleuriae]
MVQLKSWRHVKSLYRDLRKKGWNESSLRGTRMFAWRSSKSSMIHGALDNQYLIKLGLVSLESRYMPLVTNGN